MPLLQLVVVQSARLLVLLRRHFPWSRVPGYWGAQMVGAVFSAFLLRLFFGLAGHLGATLPHYGTVEAFVMEVLLTFLLVTVIVATGPLSRRPSSCQSAQEKPFTFLQHDFRIFSLWRSAEERGHRQGKPLLHGRELYFAHLRHNDADIVFPTTCQCCLDEGMGRLCWVRHGCGQDGGDLLVAHHFP